MSRLAVKEFIRAGIATNSAAVVANTTTWTRVDTFRQIPKFEKLGAGLFVVMGPITRREQRRTGGRGAGQKTIEYDIKVWIVGVAKDENVGGDDFDTALENLSQVFRSTDNAATSITDPITGATSWFLGIGEHQEDFTEEPQLGREAGQVRFFAEKTVHGTEWINA